MGDRASTGAASELIAAADLLKHGFGVLRSLSPACPFDLAVFPYSDTSALMRVEVKTGSIGPFSKTISWPPLKHPDDFEILAVVLPRDEEPVVYFDHTLTRIWRINGYAHPTHRRLPPHELQG